MYIDKKRFRKTGKFSFIVYDSSASKNVRLKEDEVPSWVRSAQDADRFCRMKEAEGESMKLKAKRREEWKTKFYKFDELLERYKEDRKEKARESWENDIYYLRQYVFNYFLNERAANNLNNWPDLFTDFKKWLQQVKPIKGKKPVLAFSTMNHCIKALNTFLSFVREQGEMQEAGKCSMFPKSKIRRKELDAVIPEDVEERIFHALMEHSKLMAIKYKVAIHTGLRDSELQGLSIGDINRGFPPQEHVRRMLDKNGINCRGYITLQDQLADAMRPRDAHGHVIRKPLKHKKKVSSKYNRVIPIECDEVYRALAELFAEQQKRFQQQVHGTNPRDYLLFDGIKPGSYRNALIAASCKAKVKYFTPHDCRHTFATRLAGRTGGDYALCMLILGHQDMETTQGYLHICDLMQSDLANKRALADGLGLPELCTT